MLSSIVGQQSDRIFGEQGGDPTAGHRLLAAGVVLAVILGATLAGWVIWRVSRFRVDDTTLELRTGMLFRQHRQVRYDRIQAIDVVRPVLARLTGVSELRVQAAGGNDSGLRLAYLGQDRALELRERLVALAGRSDEEQAAHDGAPPELEARRSGVVVRVPNLRVLQSTLYSGVTVFVLVGVLGVAVALAHGVPGVLVSVGPVVLGTAGQHLQHMVSHLNFELRHGPQGVQVRRGLTDLRTSSVPVHRIQAVEVRQPWFWRLTGWWEVHVNIAGVEDDEQDSDTVLLPAGSSEEALRVLHLVHPAVAPHTVWAAMAASGPAPGFVGVPPRARWLSPLSCKRIGYAVTPDALVLRGGAVRRFATVVPHARIQSLALAQGPMQRHLDLASVRMVSTPGSLSPGVEHLDTEAATALLNQQVVRSGRARALAAPLSTVESVRTACGKRADLVD